MNRLPDPTARQPHATQAGQPTPDTLRRAAQIAAAVDAVYQQPTSFRDDTLPATYTIGPTPPEPQPGRTPMSQRATDDSVRMLCGGFLTLCAGTAAAAVLHYSNQADPTVIGLIAATPAGLAIPILALSRLAKRVKETVEAAPPVINQTYTGPVTQNSYTANSHNRGIWASNRNQLPSGTGEQGKRL